MKAGTKGTITAKMFDSFHTFHPVIYILIRVRTAIHMQNSIPAVFQFEE